MVKYRKQESEQDIGFVNLRFTSPQFYLFTIYDSRFTPVHGFRFTVHCFFINSNTAEVIALTPVRSVGSGNGANNAECSEGKGVPVARLCFTFSGSTAPREKSTEGIFCSRLR